MRAGEVRPSTRGRSEQPAHQRLDPVCDRAAGNRVAKTLIAPPIPCGQPTSQPWPIWIPSPRTRTTYGLAKHRLSGTFLVAAQCRTLTLEGLSPASPRRPSPRPSASGPQCPAPPFGRCPAAEAARRESAHRDMEPPQLRLADSGMDGGGSATRRSGTCGGSSPSARSFAAST